MLGSSASEVHDNMSGVDGMYDHWGLVVRNTTKILNLIYEN